MITCADDYFAKGCGRCRRFDTADCSTRRWSSGLRALRQICSDVQLLECAKWGHPCYTHQGRNIALIGAFRDDFRLSFFNAALMKDPQKILEKAGPNTRHAGVIRFTEAAAVTALESSLRAYLKEAMGYAEAGLKPPKEKHDLEYPDELRDALDCDPELAEGFFQLTPGRQRSYVINLNAAKKPETRLARIEKFRPKILSGKGATER